MFGRRFARGNLHPTREGSRRIIRWFAASGTSLPALHTSQDAIITDELELWQEAHIRSEMLVCDFVCALGAVERHKPTAD